MKSYTDIEQSKKLAKILPIESADMYYLYGDETDEHFGKGFYEEIEDWLCDGSSRPVDIPCWSLAALLSSLPRIEDLKPVLDLEINYIQYPSDIDLSATADNLVDVCVKMILKLKENNLI